MLSDNATVATSVTPPAVTSIITARFSSCTQFTADKLLAVSAASSCCRWALLVTWQQGALRPARL